VNHRSLELLNLRNVMKNVNPHSLSRRLSTLVCLILGATFTVGGPGLLVAQEAEDKPVKEARIERKKVERPKPVEPAETTPPARPGRPGGKSTSGKAHDDNRETEKSKRAWLGVEPVEVPEAVRDYLDLTEGFGVAVRHVVSGSPADKAGLKEKDILLRLDDQLLTTPRHLQVLVATYRKGDAIELTILRKGTESVVKATLGESELPPLSMLPDEPAQFEIVDPRIPNVEPIARAELPPAVRPDSGVPGIARLGQEELQKRIADYRAEMKEWMKQPAATRGPSPTLNLHGPKAAARNAVPPAEEAGDKENKVEINAGGVKITGGPSITIGHGASIRAGGGAVKINNANGSVSVKTVDEKPVIEIHNDEGSLIYSGPYQRSDDMIEKLPGDARAVLKKMNLNNLNLLNIQVGGQ